MALAVLGVCAELDDLSGLPAYKPEVKVAGAIRCFGSELKGQTELWEKGFLKFHPDAVFSNNFITSSEGAMAGLYTGLSDVAPAGDDAKISDQMPFYNTFRYLPTEISVATGGYEARGTLWAVVIVVNKDNPTGEALAKATGRYFRFRTHRRLGWDPLHVEVCTRPGREHPYLGPARVERRLG